MTGAEMEALIQRVEAAQGPDRELDAAIWCGLRGYISYGQSGGIWGYEMPGLGISSVDVAAIPAYTASLDAAVSLVPEGHWWNVGRTCADNSPMRHFGTRSGHCFTAGCAPWGRDQHTTAATPALALCAAALRARLAMEGGDER